MKEMITVEQAERVLRIIAVASPMAGTLIGLVIGALRKRISAFAGRGLLLGLLGTAVFGLWKVYNLSGSRYGYTSVVSILVQFALLFALGMGAGFTVRRAIRPPHGTDERRLGRTLLQEENRNAS